MDSGRAVRVLVAWLVLAGGLALPWQPGEPARAEPADWSGDRTVDDNQTYSGDTILLAGNLTIRGSLTFRGVDLEISSPSNATYRIDVENGGAFHLLAGSRIHSTDPNIHFAFRARPGATFVMNDSELNDCGWDDIVQWKARPIYERGLYIEGTDASITNSTLRGNYFGVILDQQTSSYIFNNNISGNEGIGIYISGGSTPTIDHNTVSGNLRYALSTEDFAGITSRWSTPFISNNTVSANLDLRANYSAGGIKLYGGGTSSVVDNTICGHDEPGYLQGLMGTGCGLVVTGNRIHNNSNGMYIDTGASIVEGNLIENNIAPGHDKDGRGVSDGSRSSFRNNTIFGSNIGICLEGSTSSFQNDTIARNARGVDELGGPFTVTMTNCTFVQNAWDVYLAGWGFGNYPSTLSLVNPSYDEKKVTSINEGDSLSVGWSVRSRVLYENGSRPVEGAEVRFGNAPGALVATCQTGPDGWTETLTLEEFCITVGNKAVKSPYNISARSGARSNWTGWTPINSSRELAIILDDMPPRLSITGPANNSLTNQPSVQVRGDCEPGAELRVNWEPVAVGPDGSWSAPVRLDAEGPNEIIAESRDRCGNSATERRTVFRDTTFPLLTLTDPHDGFLTNQGRIAVNGSCSDPAARTTVNGREVALDADGRFSTLVDLAEGPNTITAESRDRAGNAARAVLAGELDTLPPLLRVVEPRPGLLTNLSAVTVRGLAEEGCELTVNGLRCLLSGMEFSAVLNLQEGQNEIRVAARDRAGNLNRSTITATLDTLAPSLSIDSPRDGELCNTSLVRLRGTTEEGAFLAVNGVEAEPSGASFCVTLQLREGANLLTVEASDGAGNRALKVLTVTVDTVAPGLVLESPADRTLTNLTSIELRGRTDQGAFVTVNGLGVFVGRDGSFVAQVELGREGRNTITVRSRDNAWNLAEEVRTVTRDTVLYYNITAPANGARVDTRTVTVAGDAEPGARIGIGNLTVHPGADGRFSREVPLAYGPNAIVITVMDAAGNTAITTLDVTRVRPSAPAPARGLVPGFTTAAALAAAALAIVAVGWGRRRKES